MRSWIEPKDEKLNLILKTLYDTQPSIWNLENN